MKKLLAILFLVAGIVIIALLMQVQMKGKLPGAGTQNNPIDGMELPLDEMSDGMKSVVKNIDDETAHQVFDYVKQKSKDGSLSTKDGIKKTIRWYLDNRTWWEEIISGEYQNYYQRMYGNR